MKLRLVDALLGLLTREERVSVHSARQCLGISLPTADKYLTHLVGTGLVVRQTERQKRGRPRFFYALVSKVGGAQPAMAPPAVTPLAAQAPTAPALRQLPAKFYPYPRWTYRDAPKSTFRDSLQKMLTPLALRPDAHDAVIFLLDLMGYEEKIVMCQAKALLDDYPRDTVQQYLNWLLFLGVVERQERQIEQGYGQWRLFYVMISLGPLLGERGLLNAQQFVPPKKPKRYYDSRKNVVNWDL